MRRNLFILPLLLAGPAFAAQPELTDPVELLHAVAKTYASGTETFHVEAIRESVNNNELHRDWQKTYLSAIKDSGNHYRIETRSGFGSWVEDSDGTNEWLYMVEAKKYVKRPLPEKWPQFPATSGYDLREAWAMRAWLEGEAGRYKRAAMLPQETIVVEGKSFPCYVVHVTSEDSTEARDKETPSDTTFWIDKQGLVFRKKVEHRDTFTMLSQTIRLPTHLDTTTVYPVADFHPATTALIFAFTPPAGSTEIATFDSGFAPPLPAPSSRQMVGKTVAAITFHSADGKTVDIASYRGKPLLLDLWATWCGPCLLSMPALNHIYADYKSRGLVVITVDQDHVAENATAYLTRHQYAWTNYHDAENKTGKALQDASIPLTVLIDAKGRIVYYDEGGDEAALRKAIGSLGTEFAAVTKDVGTNH